MFRLGSQHDLALTKKVLEAKKEANEKGSIEAINCENFAKTYFSPSVIANFSAQNVYGKGLF